MSAMSVIPVGGRQGQWQTEEAKQRFNNLVEAAAGRGPQVVMRHEEPIAVMLSQDDYRRLVRQADANFGHLFSVHRGGC
jgi:prevent-host-death family protein